MLLSPVPVPRALTAHSAPAPSSASRLCSKTDWGVEHFEFFEQEWTDGQHRGGAEGVSQEVRAKEVVGSAVA